LSFEDVAKEIVSETISTAVCIDDEFVQPYEEVDYKDSSFTFPKKMYDSFRENSCILDVYKYCDSESWDKDKETILKKKDLLILDWQLSDIDPEFKDALSILHNAVTIDSLPFVYIYTHVTDLDRVILNINSYFSGLSVDDMKVKKDLLISTLEELDIDDGENILHEIGKFGKDLIVNPTREKDVKEKIFQFLRKELGEENARDFRKRFYEKGKPLLKSENDFNFLTKIGMLHAGCTFPSNRIENIEVFPLRDVSYSYLIHNTLVKISKKRGDSNVVSPEKVYEDLSETICKRRSFLAFLGLEIRNLFRNVSSVIGKGFNEIDELSFFYHQDILGPENADDFNNFLIDTWKAEASSFLLGQNMKLFEVLDEYKNNNNISEDLVTFRGNTLYQNLAKLNYFYSVYRNDEWNSRNVGFGDIFFKKVEDSSTDFEEFFLCITPHCDCIHPGKIGNSLYFSRGKKIALSKGLKKAETGFITFLEFNDKTICIEWEKSPFQIFIPPERNDITQQIECSISDTTVILKHIALQKESYTQRIANESFSWANRVGIAFAKIEIEEEGEKDC